MSDHAGALTAHARVPWERARELLDGLTAAWQDLDGWHRGSCSVDLPVGATHLWAWSDDRLVVARIHPDDVITLAELRTTTDPSNGEPVSYRVERSMGYAVDDDRVEPSVAGSDGERLIVDGASELVFVRLPDLPSETPDD